MMMIQYPTEVMMKKGMELTRQLKEFYNTEEYKNWKENPTEENLKKAKEIRKTIVK